MELKYFESKSNIILILNDFRYFNDNKQSIKTNFKLAK